VALIQTDSAYLRLQTEVKREARSTPAVGGRSGFRP